MRLFRPSRQALLRVFLPLILLSYFGTLALAALLFPEPYDWRYRVISNLLSPRDDPRWYRIPSIGIAVAGVLMLPLAGYLEARLRSAAPRWARFGHWMLSGGIVLLILAALVVPQHVHTVMGLRHLHEALSRTSAIFFGLGMLACCVCAWRDRAGARTLDARLLPCWCALTVLPLGGILVSEALLLAARAFPAWGAPVKESLRHSVLWHLGFWEWTGSAAVFAFWAISAWWLPASPPVPAAEER
jgi:succinate dehydrogenase/fumarate reductase cytochrome b subunit